MYPLKKLSVVTIAKTLPKTKALLTVGVTNALFITDWSLTFAANSCSIDS